MKATTKAKISYRVYKDSTGVRTVEPYPEKKGKKGKKDDNDGSSATDKNEVVWKAA